MKHADGRITNLDLPSRGIDGANWAHPPQRGRKRDGVGRDVAVYVHVRGFKDRHVRRAAGMAAASDDIKDRPTMRSSHPDKVRTRGEVVKGPNLGLSPGRATAPARRGALG